MSLADKLIINAAITGMVPTKDDSPFVPTTIDEIVACAQQVYDAGASIVHFHARDAHGVPTSDAERYTELIGRVRQALPDLIICVSLSGRNIGDADQRAAPLAVRPDLASLTLGSLNFPQQASVNAPDVIRDLAGRIYQAGAVPELEVFEPGFINAANYLIRKELLHPPYYFNLILGSLGASPLDLVGLGHMIGLLPKGATWSVGGIGRFQLDANVMAVASGGHVRVGLEDNLFYDRRRTKLADNRRLVERIARIGRELGRDVATPEEARSIIGLPHASGDAQDLGVRRVA